MFASRSLSKLRTKSACMTRLILKASICHKSQLPPKKVYHWPYEKYTYNALTMWLDIFTEKKFDENSMIIQLDGNIDNGKCEFGRKLADELGMKFFEPIDLEREYINEDGYDLRALNPLLPERVRYCDLEMFHENPSRHSAIHMQMFMFKHRLYQYIKALQHLFNTGQGVILPRSAFTERVFVEAAHNLGWLPMGYLRSDGVQFYDWKHFYLNVRNLALADICLFPKLTIYLETPVDTCMARIKASSDPMIANSKALIPEYLENIERAYEDIVLPKQETNGIVFRVDHPRDKSREEILDVVQDLEKLDFTYDMKDMRFETWDPDFMYFWHSYMRRRFTSYRALRAMRYLNQKDFDIAGLGDSLNQELISLRAYLIMANVGIKYGYKRDLPWYHKYKNLSSISGFLKSMHLGKRLDDCVFAGHDNPW